MTDSKETYQTRIRQLTDAMETCLSQDLISDFEDVQNQRQLSIEAFFQVYSDSLNESDRIFFDEILLDDKKLEAELKNKKQQYFESVKVQKRLQDGLSAYKLGAPGKQR